ncbi:hypothetical protein SCHIN_v1c07550 [Spiroplasma chinense]|uniref:DUF2130 domain-containing protein n=1 Tax=Spiroplasma chinense TaxID=216932 RepID=A0A5B9Y4R6_9MOLU|nr:DUF2130 domain-containing protein [Spiroplasma chinense]QEH61950.1 hypothetical protein SCHIN_v1c07550 [Spiroplasma chinense]
MELNFLCPKCGQTITEKDFDQSEQSLKHLHEFFNSKENIYKEELSKEIKKSFDKQKQLELDSLKTTIESSYIEKVTKLENTIQNLSQESENKLALSVKETENKYIKIITDLEASLKNLQTESESKISLTEKNIEAKYLQQLADLNQQIELLKSESTSKISIAQKEVENKYIQQISELTAQLDKVKTQSQNELETLESKIKLTNQELLNSKNLEIEKLKNELASIEDKSKLASKELIENYRQEYENKLAIANAEITELKISNAQNKVIQNKTKGENFEHDVEGELRKVFVNDIIEKINDATKKADFRHTIKEDGQVMGKIIYEVKNAEWKNTWEKKLTEDMAREESKYGILVATSFNDQYRGIPFKVSDQNPNIFLTDADSFTFVGNIVRMLIRTENKLIEKYKDGNQSEKIKEFNNWRDTSFIAFSKMLEDQFKRIEQSESSITLKINDIRIARQKIVGQWLKVVKTFIEGMNI